MMIEQFEIFWVKFFQLYNTEGFLIFAFFFSSFYFSLTLWKCSLGFIITIHINSKKIVSASKHRFEMAF